MISKLKKRWKILKTLWLPLSDHQISAHAAAAAYYILLSFLPASALIFTILSLLPLETLNWSNLLNEFLPQNIQPVVTYLIAISSPQRPAAILSIWAILTLWSAAKGIMSLSIGITAVLKIKNKKGFFRRRAEAMLIFFLLTLVLFFTILILVFGQWFLFYLPSVVPHLETFLFIILSLRHLCGIFMLFILFTSLYRLIMGRKFPLKSCVLAGSIAAVGWVAISYAFSIYVNLFVSNGHRYGGLSLLLAGGLWLKICINLLLYSVILSNLLISRKYHPILVLRRAFGRSDP